MVESRKESTVAAPVVVLNLSREMTGRESRARMLNQAGCYTISVENPADAVALAGQIYCAFAVVCSSFKPTEQRTIRRNLQRISPTTRIVLLRCTGEEESQFLRLIQEVDRAGSQGSLAESTREASLNAARD